MRGCSLALPNGSGRLHLDTAGDRHYLFQVRVSDWRSWLPLAHIIIAAFDLYHASSGRCGELLSGDPTP